MKWEFPLYRYETSSSIMEKDEMRKTKSCMKLFIFALLSILVAGCATSIVFKPDTSNPQSSTILADSMESRYVHNEQIEFSAGLDFYNTDSLLLHLYFKNNSQEPIRVDPAAMHCQGSDKDGNEEMVAIQEPDKYVHKLLSLNAVAVALGGFLVDKKASIYDFSRSLLRKQDILPGQQIKGLVLISRVFIEKQTHDHDSRGGVSKIQSVS